MFLAVLTADAVVTGEVSCCNFIVQLHSLPQFAELIFTFDAISFLADLIYVFVIYKR